MFVIKSLIQNRIKELGKKCNNNKIKICVYIWNLYKNAFDYDKVWENQYRFKDKGTFILESNTQSKDFEKLVKIAEECFKPYIKNNKTVNFKDFVLDILIHMQFNN